MAITREPVIENTPAKKVSEKKLQDFINGGGAPTSKAKATTSAGVTKSIKLIMTGDEMETIKSLRDKRPHRSRKITISVHDWVIEAIQEKIERERRKYSVQ
jgi:hypothetical protein